MKLKQFFYNYIYIIIGCTFSAFGTACFLLPNKLSSGGFSGIATVIYYFYKIPMGTTIILLNIPVFIWAFIKLGRNFMTKTIVATLLYSNLLDVFERFQVFANDKFLASIYGGILVGIGLAIVFKVEASTGGTDLIAHLVQFYNGKIRISNILVFVDILIVIINLIAFKIIEVGLYSAITIYIVGKMIDFVFEGINFCKIIYIISDEYEKILEAINKQGDRGATGLYGKGSFKKKEKLIVMCVTKRIDIMKIKNIATEIDKGAFIVITDAREVYGLGFKN